jgi:hypothetical protein
MLGKIWKLRQNRCLIFFPIHTLKFQKSMDGNSEYVIRVVAPEAKRESDVLQPAEANCPCSQATSLWATEPQPGCDPTLVTVGNLANLMSNLI